MNTVVGFVALCGLSAVTAGNEPPVISFSSDGVNGGETLLLCGDGFDQPELKMGRWLPPQPTREEWPDTAVQRASLERAIEGEATPPATPEDQPKNLTRQGLEPTGSYRSRVQNRSRWSLNLTQTRQLFRIETSSEAGPRTDASYRSVQKPAPVGR